MIPPCATLTFLVAFIFAFPPGIIAYWTHTRRNPSHLLLILIVTILIVTILIVTILIIPIALLTFWSFNKIWIAKRFFRPYHRMEVVRRRRLGQEELGVEMAPFTREYVDRIVEAEKEREKKENGKGKGKETDKKDNGKGKGKGKA